MNLVLEFWHNYSLEILFGIIAILVITILVLMNQLIERKDEVKKLIHDKEVTKEAISDFKEQKREDVNKIEALRKDYAAIRKECETLKSQLSSTDEQMAKMSEELGEAYRDLNVYNYLLQQLFGDGGIRNVNIAIALVDGAQSEANIEFLAKSLKNLINSIARTPYIEQDMVPTYQAVIKGYEMLPEDYKKDIESIAIIRGKLESALAIRENDRKCQQKG